MSDLISRQAMIDVMRKHKALFCKNRIEFMALSKDEKARVDEIDNCISDLVNAPDAETTAIVKDFGHPCGTYGYCSNCGGYCVNEEPYCPHCGAKVEWK